MNLKLPQLVALTAGFVLLYSAIKDVSPASVLKSVLTGTSLPAAGSGGGGGTLPAKTPVTDSNGNSDGYINGDGQYIPRTDQNTPQPQPTPTPGGPQYNVPTAYRQPYAVVSV